MKALTLCADDFGLNDQVNKGIIDLVRARRLNAVSCMVVGDRIEEGAEALLNVLQKIDFEVEIGLHLTFTEYKPISVPLGLTSDERFGSIGSLILKSHFGMVEQDEVSVEMAHQFDRFNHVFGRPPDFVDGHQHVHLLPILRETLLRSAPENLANGGWLRSCHQSLAGIFRTGTDITRTSIIANLAKPLKRSLAKSQIETNELFLGVNDFSGKGYPEMMAKWLKTAADFDGCTVIMCHPGHVSEGKGSVFDPISQHRPHEFVYFASAQFLLDMESSGLSLTN
ncbi:MAG: ChbG/HpnK family deacetylase [Pseudomonadota bacterium]